MPRPTRQPASALAQPARPHAHTALRLFVAIAPPAEVMEELDALTAPLRAARGDLRWTSRAAWHVTLAFLGQVEETALASLLPRLERAARRHEAIRLAFCGGGAFPAAHRANVLWSGLSGDRRALASLAASVAAGASRAGAAPPDRNRRYQPHLTLARCRLPADVSTIITALAGFQGQAWVADRIHLVSSRGGGNGTGDAPASTQPRYTTVASWPLRHAPGPGATSEP